jgi:hypothetical protein
MRLRRVSMPEKSPKAKFMNIGPKDDLFSEKLVFRKLSFGPDFGFFHALFQLSPEVELFIPKIEFNSNFQMVPFLGKSPNQSVNGRQKPLEGKLPRSTHNKIYQSK